MSKPLPVLSAGPCPGKGCLGIWGMHKGPSCRFKRRLDMCLSGMAWTRMTPPGWAGLGVTPECPTSPALLCFQLKNQSRRSRHGSSTKGCSRSQHRLHSGTTKDGNGDRPSPSHMPSDCSCSWSNSVFCTEANQAGIGLSQTLPTK